MHRKKKKERICSRTEVSEEMKRRNKTHEQNLNDSRLHVCIILTRKGSISQAKPSKLAWGVGGGAIVYHLKMFLFFSSVSISLLPALFCWFTSSYHKIKPTPHHKRIWSSCVSSPIFTVFFLTTINKFRNLKVKIHWEQNNHSERICLLQTLP